MVGRAYTWDETQNEERRAEAVLDAIYGPQYIIVKALRAHQKQGIARFHINRRDGTEFFSVDYKSDSWAKKTGNLPIEDVSVRRAGRLIARGWASSHTRQNFIASLFPG